MQSPGLASAGGRTGNFVKIGLAMPLYRCIIGTIQRHRPQPHQPDAGYTKVNTMNLLDILLKELKEWPAGAEFAYQFHYNNCVTFEREASPVWVRNYYSRYTADGPRGESHKVTHEEFLAGRKAGDTKVNTKVANTRPKLQEVFTRRGHWNIEFVAVFTLDEQKGEVVAYWDENDGKSWVLMVSLPSFVHNSECHSATCEKILASNLADSFGLDSPEREIASKLWEEALKHYPRISASESYYGH